ncbi:DWNN-domain-containing protein [Hymenopellis radicata]|nr:DWNN-domain-containing protein [Hymenopellis radicata]
MASSVFYRWKSRKDESRVTFDGTGITVFDLKRDIILANNMSKANDFDLYLYDFNTEQEYKDDAEIIPRSSYVIVKRMPAARPGKGKAGFYTAGAANVIPTSEPVSRGGMTYRRGAISKRFDEPAAKPVSASNPIVPAAGATDDEAAAMAAMFQAQTANWEETQEKMSQFVAPSRASICVVARSLMNVLFAIFSLCGARGGKPVASHQAFQTPDRALPPSYVCYRCGQKGHWIKDCPTNNDREYDNKPRIKRTTGIPRSMLKVVENPNSGGPIGPGVMVTPEGGYVVAQPDLASWKKQISKSKALTTADVRDRVPSDATLICPIDNKLFRDAVKTPCCGSSYCEECIQTHLLERDFICPNCSKKIASLDGLEADTPTRAKVNDYIEGEIEKSRTEGADEEMGMIRPMTDGPSVVCDFDDTVSLDQDFYSDEQPGSQFDMQSMLVNSIPQLQAQIQQLSVMLQNPSLPVQVRQQTEMQYQQVQIQLEQAQTVSVALSAFQQQQQQMQNMQSASVNGAGGYSNWGAAYMPQQVAGQDSAYQRLPVNNRRRNVKRERPSDFLEVGGESENKAARYWE